LEADAFLAQVQGERAADADAPLADSGLATPTEAVPGACATGDYFNYDALNQLISDASEALSLEEYLKRRLNDACGDSAAELAGISADLQARLTEAAGAKSTCIADFFNDFGGEQTLEEYTADIDAAYAAAKESGIPARDDVTVELPDSPDTCEDFVNAVEAEIAARRDELVDALDCTDFVVDTVCTALGQTVEDIEAANSGIVDEIGGRVRLILNDILQIEGEEGEDVVALDERLRLEFDAEDDSGNDYEAGIELPSATLPAKCAAYTSYEDLDTLIDFVEDLLAYEDWLRGRLLESCGTAGQEYQAVIDSLQGEVDASNAEKDALVDGFFADFGEGATREEYAADLTQKYEAAVEAGETTSNFVPNAAIPDSPESCSSITSPLFLQISQTQAELTGLQDCIDFTTTHVCTELADTVSTTVADNQAQLAEKGAAVLAKLDILAAVSAEEDEAPEAFALRLRGDYQADLAAGDFSLVDINFGAPTETFPAPCSDLASYDDLNQLVADVTDACSFDAWLQAAIDTAAGDAVAAHEAEVARLEDEAAAAETAALDLVEALYQDFDVAEELSLEDFRLYLQSEFDALAAQGSLPGAPENPDFTIPSVPAGLEALVEDLRADIAAEAEALGAVLDFNKFASDFVCEEAVEKIVAAIAVQTTNLNDAAATFAGVLDDLFIVEGADGQTRMAFETQLRDEWAAALAAEAAEVVVVDEGATGLAQQGDGEPVADEDSEADAVATVELPYDAVPVGCAAGQAKL
jgi:hypothetical protein